MKQLSYFLVAGSILLAACSSPSQENKAKDKTTTEQRTTDQTTETPEDSKLEKVLIEKECKLVGIQGMDNEQVLLVFREFTTNEKYEFQISAMEMETLQKGMMEIKHGKVIANPAAMQAEYVIAFEEKEKTNKKTGETKTGKRLRNITKK